MIIAFMITMIDDVAFFSSSLPHQIRDALRTRYAYLPYLYSVFQHAAATGVPIMR